MFGFTADCRDAKVRWREQLRGHAGSGRGMRGSCGGRAAVQVGRVARLWIYFKRRAKRTTNWMWGLRQKGVWDDS